MIRKGHFATS